MISPVGWTGLALPDQMIEIVRGQYEGTPEPEVTLAVLRSGGSEQVLEVPRFALLASDLDSNVTIIERATNPHGSVQTEAVVEVSRLAPTAIVVSGLTDVTESTILPVAIAHMSADGTAPLDWSITAGGDGLAIDLTGASPVLRVVAMPTAGLQQVTITAANAAGSASVDLEFEVLRSVVAPEGISLSEAARDVIEDDTLPVDLAELFCESSSPVSWSVPSGGERFVIDSTGEVPVLRMFSMPPLGSHVIEIEASNDGGTATARFVLNVGAGGVATAQITQNPAGAIITTDAEVPTLLSVLTADGSAPVSWSLVSGGDFCELQANGSQAMLRLIAMPAEGDSTVTVRAENAKGSAACDFALSVQAPVAAPHDLLLSVEQATMAADATLPCMLAMASVQGTAPFDWSLIDAEPYFELDLSGDAPALMLVEMPGEGRYSVEVEAANAAGRARATLYLVIVPAVVAPATLTMAPADAIVEVGQALPIVSFCAWNGPRG